MKHQNFLIEAISAAILAFCLAALSSCAHDKKMNEQIQKEAQEQPVVGPSGRAAEADKTIQSSNLSPQQKAKLQEIATSANRDLTKLRHEEAQLRLLLIKQLVNPNVPDREIEGIKQRVLEANKKSNKRWLAALDDAREVLGRRSEEDLQFYRVFMQEPLPPPEDGGRFLH